MWGWVLYIYYLHVEDNLKVTWLQIAKCSGGIYGPLAYLGFMSPDRGIFTRGVVIEKVVGTGGSANKGG